MVAILEHLGRWPDPQNNWLARRRACVAAGQVPQPQIFVIPASAGTGISIANVSAQISRRSILYQSQSSWTPGELPGSGIVPSVNHSQVFRKSLIYQTASWTPTELPGSGVVASVTHAQVFRSHRIYQSYPSFVQIPPDQPGTGKDIANVSAGQIFRKSFIYQTLAYTPIWSSGDGIVPSVSHSQVWRKSFIYQTLAQAPLKLNDGSGLDWFANLSEPKRFKRRAVEAGLIHSPHSVTGAGTVASVNHAQIWRKSLIYQSLAFVAFEPVVQRGYSKGYIIV